MPVVSAMPGAEYVALKASMIREGCDMNSPKVGKLKKGTRIEVLERQVNDEGATRVRFAEGWTSEVLKDGTRVLELVSGTADGAAPAPAAPATAPAEYVALKAGVIREGFDMSSPNVGKIKKKARIQVLERQLNSEGATRVRFVDGWTTEVLKDGTRVLELVSGTAPELKPPPASTAAAPAPSPAPAAAPAPAPATDSDVAEYVVLKKSFVREGFDMNSPKAGVLQKQARVQVLERQENSDGVIRARFAEGWTSEVLKDGTRVLELVSGSAPELKPAPASAASKVSLVERMTASAPASTGDDNVQAMMDKAKTEIVLATLAKHGGSCTFETIMAVAEEHHCDVAGAAINSLKRAKKLDYEGMMLLLPRDAAVVIRTLGATSPSASAPAPASALAPAPAPSPAPRPVVATSTPGTPQAADISERWCKKCAAVFTTQKCPGGHPIFMYSKNIPGAAAALPSASLPRPTPQKADSPPKIPKKASSKSPPGIPKASTSPPKIPGNAGSSSPPKIPRKPSSSAAAAAAAAAAAGDAPGPAVAEYVVLKKSFVREGFDMNSPKAGVLQKQARVQVLERQENSDGVIRARFAEGWTSEVLKDGTRVLELVSGSAPELKPAPASAAAAPAPAPVVPAPAAAAAQEAAVQKAEADRIAAQEEAAVERARIAAEEEAHTQAQAVQKAEADRIAAEEQAAAERTRIAAEKEAQAQAEADRIAAEEQAAAERTRIAAEEEAHTQAEAARASDQAQAEAQRVAAAEQTVESSLEAELAEHAVSRELATPTAQQQPEEVDCIKTSVQADADTKPVASTPDTSIGSYAASVASATIWNTGLRAQGLSPEPQLEASPRTTTTLESASPRHERTASNPVDDLEAWLLVSEQEAVDMQDSELLLL